MLMPTLKRHSLLQRHALDTGTLSITSGLAGYLYTVEDTQYRNPIDIRISHPNMHECNIFLLFLWFALRMHGTRYLVPRCCMRFLVLSSSGPALD